MGSTTDPNLKCGITINGVDAFEINPLAVSSMIHSDETGTLKAIFESKMYDTEFPLPDNYAEHAGRPSLSEVPFMGSENDGYPFLPGHSPLCDGEEYHNGMCKCKYDEWNAPGGVVNSLTTEMWPGGPCMDDFDM